MNKPQNSFRWEDNVITHTRLLNAPRELVWEVWTDPVHLKEWWGPNDFTITTRSMQVAPGQRWVFIMHGMGQDWDNAIEYLEVTKPTRLVYRHGGAEDEDYNFTVAVTFEEVDDKTLLTMQSTFKSKAIIEELNRKVNAIEGGKQTLGRLTEYVENLKAYPSDASKASNG